MNPLWCPSPGPRSQIFSLNLRSEWFRPLHDILENKKRVLILQFGDLRNFFFDTRDGMAVLRISVESYIIVCVKGFLKISNLDGE